jgi:hypothetical protein
MQAKVCEAGKGTYIPNLQDIERYCKKSDFRVCPLYCRAERGVKQVQTVFENSSAG